ncbi:rRNA maturation RNase YbeY [Jiella avicenniae]|uniref:Endoribonuclease YbeY n=1 Tax=Jiella avicenniae TaxID=2907202 RepID=A0A9X1P4N1_9HYPH|nr:rRNA maturation RNase YbeY [Jiella avicenniae]MCE7030271.1 rRNA maturation RNase YbeY [Jiella avicenniae]
METRDDRDSARREASAEEEETAVASPVPGFAALTVVIGIADEAWSDAFGDADLVALTHRALAAAARHLALPDAIETEVSVTFADDATVAEANRAWRGKDRPTNILSFPMVQLAPGALPGPLAGDLLLAFETLAREAAAEDKPLADHLTHLLVHGFLHLMGHDHVEEDEAAAMEATEIAILAGLGIADPYRDPARRPASHATD